MGQNLTMEDLVTKLSKLGFSKGYVKNKELPSWYFSPLNS